MGTPMMALNSNGKKVWSQTLDIFGRNTEKNTNFVPFRYQGQYYDEETGLSYNRFRYYDDSTGQYISQDPIGLAGNNPTLYGYVNNSNKYADIFGLKTFPSPITNGSVYRGVFVDQPTYSPSAADIAGYKDNGMGLSTKPKLNSQAKKFFAHKNAVDVLEVDVEKLSNLQVIQDNPQHASILPSQEYLDKRNMSMSEVLEEWKDAGDEHELSKELKQSSKSTHH